MWSVNYTASVTLGGSQHFTFVLDTGSTTTAVAGASCAQCIDGGVSPLYSPGATATDESATAASNFGNGSGWSGEIYQDSISLPGAPPIDVNFVSIASQTSFFYDLDYYCDASITGILGFGPSTTLLRGTTSYVDQLNIAGSPRRVLVSSSARTTARFGWAESTPSSSPNTHRWWAGPATSYTVVVSSIDVSGTSLGSAGDRFRRRLRRHRGRCAVVFPQTAFNAMVAALGQSSAFTSLFGSATTFFSLNNADCVQLAMTDAELDAMLPPLTLNFASGLVVQSPATSSYLLNFPGCGYVPAMFTRGAATGGLPPIEMGAPILHNKVIVIDRAHQQIGFATAQCN